MRSIGLPEVLVLFGALVPLAVIVGMVFLVVRLVPPRRVARICPHCMGSVPEPCAYCSACGQRLA